MLHEIAVQMKSKSFWLAALMTLACSIAGTLLAGLPYLNLVGALVISLILGIVFQTAPKAVNEAKSGIGFISNKFLRLGIILLGFKLNLLALLASGVKTIVLAICIVTLTVLLTYNLAKRFGVEKQLAILTACGTGICGAVAVMGISPQLEVQPDEEERKRENEVLAVAVVCIMGTVFTLLEIGLRPILHMTDVQFGVMTGGSLHEIAHAVAAGGANGAVSLDTAIITKLSRVLLLAPVAAIVGIWYSKSNNKATTEAGVPATKKKLPMPWFMLGFLLSSLIGTFLPIPANVIAWLVKLAYIFLGMAMAALGMNVNFQVIFKRGKSVFLASFISSVVLLGFVIVAAKLFF